MEGLAWRRIDAAGAAEIEGLSGDTLRTVAALWKQSGCEVTARFGGRSMEPSIVSGGEVLLRCGASPRLGDVVAFVHADQVVVHRVVALSAGRRWWLLTRGDAHVIPDLPLREPEALVGTVARIRRGSELVEPPPPPRSRARGLALAVCLAGLRIHPALGAPLVRLLRFLRRGLAAFVEPR